MLIIYYVDGNGGNDVNDVYGGNAYRPGAEVASEPARPSCQALGHLLGIGDCYQQQQRQRQQKQSQ